MKASNPSYSLNIIILLINQIYEQSQSNYNHLNYYNIPLVILSMMISSPPRYLPSIVVSEHTGPLGLTIGTIAAMLILYLLTSYREAWKKEFQNRSTRKEWSAPSFSSRPPLRRMSQVLLTAFQGNEDLDLLLLKDPKKHAGATDYSDASGDTCELSDSDDSWTISEDDDVVNSSTTGQQTIPESLDMDHLKISFWYYLFGMLFIGPNSICLWAKGLFVLKAREFLFQHGFIKPKGGYEPRKLVSKLLMESCCCPLHYVGTQDRVATFIFDSFPMLDNHGDKIQAAFLKVTVDLDKKEMIDAYLHTRQLSPDDTVCLLWFNTISADHVKIHSLANWAAPDDTENTKFFSFYHRMSAISILYNYFGFTVFPKITKLVHQLGLSTNDMHGIAEVFDHGAKAGIPYHPKLTDLSKESYVIDFILKVRSRFLRLFPKYQDTFPPGVDAESLLASTIIHSLDHTLMEWNLEDPLWLDYNRISPDFHAMAELGRFVRVGFVEDLPGIVFAKRYKDSKEPFHQAIYNHARKISVELADHMDTCIIK